MATIEFSQQQSARIAKLPEDYRVVGVDHSAPLVRKPTRADHSYAAERSPDSGHDRGQAEAGRRVAHQRLERRVPWHESS